jgi:uroporphyrinogen decarboxylase
VKRQRIVGNRFNELVLGSPHRLALPIAVYPGAALTGATVQDIVTHPQAQFEAVAALHQRYRGPVVLSAMDLSAEAEAFGCAIQMTPGEIPFVLGRLVTTLDQARQLSVPQPGDKRTSVHLETVRRLRRLPAAQCVLGGCIGPFSLAARLVGVSEAMEMTVTEPELIHALLDKATTFLTAYTSAFRDAGADGVIMAEPAAGLLSPRGVSEFSSRYIKRVGETMGADFAVILHNCAAKVLHLPALLESGLKAFHFGSPMDVAAALGRVADEVVICGNLDPTAIFVQSPPEEIRQRVGRLIEATNGHANFVLSSGCDLPPQSSLAGLDVFYEAARCGPSVTTAPKRKAFSTRTD